MSAQLLPNGRQQFIDQNGNPLVSGLVYFYIPGTTTPKNTWQDADQTILNTNPIILDARGQATIFGVGSYRQILQDAAANLIWDKDVSSPVVTATETAAGVAAIATQDAVNAGTDDTTIVTPKKLAVSHGALLDSIGGLRAISKLAFARAFVTGYYAAGDGGGGEYWYDSADTVSADNGGSIIVATDGARWKLSRVGVMSVKQFGAKADGATDATTAFTNAAAAAIGIIYVPDGSYALTGTVDGTFFATGVVTFASGGVKYLIGTYNPTYISNDRYNLGVSLLRTLRDTSQEPAYGIGCIGDGYTDQSGIDAGASAHYAFDPRKVITPTRSNAASVGSDDTSTLTGWTTFNTGTASMSAVPDANNPVVPGANVFLFDTGATLGSIAGLQKDFGSVPDAAFSVGIHIDIESTGNNSGDAFEVQVASISGYTLEFRVFSGAAQVFQDGAWQTIANYGGGNLYTEWWVNAVQNSASNYTVSVYAGTELLGSRIGNLPGGGTDGLVVLQKNSGTTANQSARVAYVNIGATQQADNMTLVSDAAANLLASPLNARVIVLVEDTSVALNPNTNLNGSVSQNNGSSWENITFTDAGYFGPGIVDPTKKVHMLVAEHEFTNVGATSPAYKITSSANWWFALLGAFLEWF